MRGSPGLTLRNPKLPLHEWHTIDGVLPFIVGMTDAAGTDSLAERIAHRFNALLK